MYDYFFHLRVLGRHPKIATTEQCFLEHKTSRANLRSLADIEELWDCVIKNYLALEHDMLAEAVNSMILLSTNYDEFQDKRLAFARHLSNFLSSCRSYLDQVPQHLRQFKSVLPKAQFTQWTHESYDALLGYRVMEALRNYAQHAGLPIHGTTFGSKWIDGDIDDADTGRLRFTVIANINLATLRESKNFKKSVLDEFDPNDKITSMRPLLREYIEGLGEVHDKLRKALKPTYVEDAERFRKSIELYKLANPDSVLGLGVAQYNKKNEVILNVPIFEELVTRVKTLQTRNGSMKNFTKRYVTSDE